MKIKILKAHNGNSFLLSFHDDNGIPRNILIDGGTTDTYHSKSRNSPGELKEEIEAIKKKKEAIDLLVLTHIDNDHICGLLEWFRRDPQSHEYIRNVWFNSGKIIAAYFNEPENKELHIPISISYDPKTGISEAIEFENYLISKGIWDMKIIAQGQEFMINGIKIHVLSPNETQLRRLLIEYRKSALDDAYTAARKKDWHINIKEFVEEEKREGFKFIQDPSPSNGSSISFVLSLNGKNYIFFGDSHPKEIVGYLRTLGYNSDNPLCAEFMQVAHHGSKANTNKELLGIIKTDNYLISTDSARHQHPDKRTLARIISINPDAIFHFNYAHVRDGIFSIYDRIDYRIRAKYSTELNFEHANR